MFDLLRVLLASVGAVYLVIRLWCLWRSLIHACRIPLAVRRPVGYELRGLGGELP